MTETSPDTKPSADKSILGIISGRSDVLLALAMIFMLALLLLPVPTWFLDASLAVSITFAIIILMTVMFLKDPLELSMLIFFALTFLRTCLVKHLCHYVRH
jgi:flagellar biosynthesis protein FlhA